jgi:hypothetical protein
MMNRPVSMAVSLIKIRHGTPLLTTTSMTPESLHVVMATEALALNKQTQVAEAHPTPSMKKSDGTVQPVAVDVLAPEPSISKITNSTSVRLAYTTRK